MKLAFATLLVVLAIAGIESKILTHDILKTDEEIARCHGPKSKRTKRDCMAYVTSTIDTDDYPSLPDACTTVTWKAAHEALGDASTLGTTNSWGSCINATSDSDYMYVTTNNVPDFYHNPYCPLGIGQGYCVDGDESCAFDGYYCGVEDSVGTSEGFTPYGDVWVPSLGYYKIPLNPNPTRSDRPGDMYSAIDSGEKSMGPALGFSTQNGVSIQGPNDAGDYNIDEAGFILPCGGHVTPPVDAMKMNNMNSAPPLYHFHKAPDCLDAFVEQNKPVSHGGTQGQHGELIGYALDGFGIYTYQDVGGSAPVLDECGGHFGPTSDDDLTNIVYHYHSTTYTPYTLACQGPALGECEGTQGGADFCGEGCGSEVCVQPGVKLEDLERYLEGFEDGEGWLEKYTNNL
ncbi:hypothetical protein TrST_g6692 [Triparma strigata]|nr:hypothetical protein TrST_g6692 [Triparma strigata]